MSEALIYLLLKFEFFKEWYKYFFLILLTVGVLAPQCLYAHQQPTTIVLLDVNTDRVNMEMQIPLSELELAFGHDVSQNAETAIEKLRPQLNEYLQAHIHPVTDGQPWSVEVTNFDVGKAEQTQSGIYQELTARLVLLPPASISTRKFSLNYDVIMHQVVTHKAIVGLRKDWETGKSGEQPQTVGVIEVNTTTTKIEPLEINLGNGGLWDGFKGMVGLGMTHIKEGTDHLLFLLVLLLPATLLVNGRNWGDFGGTKYSIARLLKIVTAFTVGHSLTLVIGALGWLRLPQQPVEILIAVSILISAIHAVRPIFPGKEMFVAAGFGLVHGLAFASVLANLNLGVSKMALSILGFNIGIELMQIFVVALVIPWLILVSKTPFYKYLRISGAVLASVAAVAWITERVSGNPNFVGNFLMNISEYAPAGILILAIAALFAFGLQHIGGKNLLEIQ